MPFFLHLFGGLKLTEGPTGTPLIGTRRKPLALLALLAVAAEMGLSRDKAAVHLWPDGDTDRVRGVLKQTIYSLRQDLKAPELFVGSPDLRLNPEVITADLWAFNLAVADGDTSGAVAAYTGPFLDGFHLPDAPLFERWVDQQRDRLARQFAAQIERLALTAMGRHEPRVAIEWWSRLVDQDPFDVRAVSGLLHACLEAGDRPRAIRYAERHMDLLRKELEITPDPEIRRLVEQARARPESSRRDT